MGIDLVEIRARQLAPLSEATRASMALGFSDEVIPDPVKEPNRRSAVVHLTLASNAAKGSVGCFEIDVRLRVTFSKETEATIPESDAEAFLSLNGLYAAWPYVRELLSSTVSRMGYPPFVLDPLVIRAEPDAAPALAKAPKK